MEAMDFRAQGAQHIWEYEKSIERWQAFSFEPRDERRIGPCNC